VRQEFEAHRDHLHAVAYRMLGSASEADDALQEAWLRLARADTDAVHNMRGWLTTVVARVCLDMLRSRVARREVSLDATLPAEGPDPEREATLADSVGLAMLVVLETLTPAERLAFVLHDMFALPFAEIAVILGRSPDAAKMLASRARRRVHTSQAPERDLAQHRRLVEAFLAASRTGDFAALIDLLDPDVVARADAFAAPASARRLLRGAKAVARQALAFSHRAEHGHVGLVDGSPAILVTPNRRLVTIITFTIVRGRIAGLEITADPEVLEHYRRSRQETQDGSGPG
jgi:RNA polymerase sigma-70 factor (ECF subfamily)